MEQTIQLPKHGNSIYDFASMKVGDIIDVEEGKAKSAGAAAWQYVKGLKVKKADKPKFSVRTLEDGSIKCYRIK